MKRPNRAAQLGASVLLLLLSGCTTYVGHRLPPDGKLPQVATGIPYTMTRPEYTVDITADADDPAKAVYTLNRTDVPDPNQRYTLALDPALLTNGKLELTLGPSGNLSEASSVSTSQVVATIKALANVAVDQIGIKALKDEASPVPSYIDDVAAYKGCAGGVVGAIEKDLRETKAVAELKKKDSGNEAVVEKYFYKSASQRDCLQKVRVALVAAETQATNGAKKPYDDAKLVPEELPRDLAKLKGAVDGWIKSDDIGAIKTANSYVKKLAGFPKLKETLDAAEKYSARKIQAQKLTDLASLFADMTPPVWRARYVKNLEAELDSKRAALQLAMLEKAPEKTQSDLQKGISDIEDRAADAVGSLAILRRVRTLDLFLADVKQTVATDGQVRFAADEHVKLREERDKLKAQLKDLLAGVSGGSDKANPKVKARANIPIRIVKASYLDALKDVPAVIFEDLSEFLIVLEPIPGTPADAAPKTVGGS